MDADMGMLVVTVIATLLSVGSAIYTFRQSQHLAGSGFRAAEDLKSDLVALLAALRSITYKGTAASQDNLPRDITMELERVREFQTSPSGYALSALAAERGSGNAPDSGNWRVLGLGFAELTGLTLDPQSQDGRAALAARRWSSEIETTLGNLTAEDVRLMASKISDLAAIIGSLKETRRLDMVLGIWFKVFDERRNAANPALALGRLRELKAKGVNDPDLDMWLGLLEDDKDAMQKALDAGAATDVQLPQLLERHKGV